ncbi:MAG: hypothetical protein EZS28_031942 [Streblomastix strix]|uniref:Acid phosphatase n=1 Tax=Streblomastix strix TaxID=222440 RepID=A0A5J4UR50_9EUKA|nr:MAG: hypothetical protein EZS28_031942 [Streblomastix strix]
MKFLAIVLLLATSELAQQTEPKLLQLIAVCRHGVRASQNRIPKRACNPFNGKWGQVTNLGRRQNVLLGESLYNDSTYKTLFQPNGQYVGARHLFLATDEDKALMTGQSIFQGIFFKQWPSDDTEPTPTVPVRSETLNIDHVLMPSVTCSKKLDDLRKNINQSDEWQEQDRMYDTYLEVINKAAGFPDTAPKLTLMTVPRAAEQIILAYEHGYTSEADNCTYNDKKMDRTVIDLATWRNKIMNRPEDIEIAKIQISPFINEVVRRMNDTINNVSNNQLVFYAADNANILAPLQLMGVESPGRAPFGSIFFFELWNLDPSVTQAPYNLDNIGVKIGYRKFISEGYNNTEGRPIVPIGLEDRVDISWFMNVTCNNHPFCTLSELQKMVYTDSEWLKQCDLVETASEKNKDTIIIILAVLFGVAVIALILIIIGIIVIHIKHKSERQREEEDDEEERLELRKDEREEQEKKRLEQVLNQQRLKQSKVSTLKIYI